MSSHHGHTPWHGALRLRKATIMVNVSSPDFSMTRSAHIASPWPLSPRKMKSYSGYSCTYSMKEWYLCMPTGAHACSTKDGIESHQLPFGQTAALLVLSSKCGVCSSPAQGLLSRVRKQICECDKLMLGADLCAESNFCEYDHLHFPAEAPKAVCLAETFWHGHESASSKTDIVTLPWLLCKTWNELFHRLHIRPVCCACCARMCACWSVGGSPWCTPSKLYLA